MEQLRKYINIDWSKLAGCTFVNQDDAAVALRPTSIVASPNDELIILFTDFARQGVAVNSSPWAFGAGVNYCINHHL